MWKANNILQQKDLSIFELLCVIYLKNIENVWYKLSTHIENDYKFWPVLCNKN